MKITLVSLIACLAACASEPEEVGTLQAGLTDPIAKVKPSTVSGNANELADKVEYAYAGTPGLVGSGRLVVYLHGQGGSPAGGEAFMSQASALGYKVVGVAYYNNGDYPNPDTDPILGLDDICAQDKACIALLYQQMFDCSPQNDVPGFNPKGACVQTRLVKLLNYLDQKHPNGGWDQFLVGSQPKWSKIVLAGHSRGSSMVAWISQQEAVVRTIMLSGPSGSTTETFPGPLVSGPQSGYALMHRYDQTVPYDNSQKIWEKSFGMAGPPYCVDPYCVNLVCSAPFAGQYCGSHQLISVRVPTVDAHNDTLNGTLYTPAWIYMLSHQL